VATLIGGINVTCEGALLLHYELYRIIIHWTIGLLRWIIVTLPPLLPYYDHVMLVAAATAAAAANVYDA